MHYEWLALAAALLWAIASLLSVQPASHLGAFAFSRTSRRITLYL